MNWPIGKTRVYGVIGTPITHSLSPAMYNAAFKHHHLDCVYVAWDVAQDKGKEAIEVMRALNIAGMSVTMPHKQAAFEACDELSDVAAVLGAVNCISREGDKLIGHNTDGHGLVMSLLDGDDSKNLAGLQTTVVGAGGAGRAAALALCLKGAEVAVVNRSQEKAQSVAAMVTEFASKRGTAAKGGAAASTGSCSAADSVADAIAQAALLVNATPLGMSEDDPLPLDVDLLNDSQRLVDLIYNPSQTPLLTQAKSRGVAAQNGVAMLVYQAIEQFEIWTNQEAPFWVMAEAAGIPHD